MLMPSLLVLLAMPGAAQHPQPPKVTVAAGVESVKYSAGALAAAPKFRLGATPIAVMGGADGPLEAELTTMGAPWLLADGRVVAADTREMHLVVFASNGALQKIIGKKGGGPGEFQAIEYFIAATGDTIISSDWMRNVMLFSTAGALLRETTVVPRGRAGMLSPAGVLSGRAIMVPTEWIIPNSDSSYRPHEGVVSMPLGAGKSDTLFAIQGPSITSMASGEAGGRRHTTSLTFANSDRVAVLPHGIVVMRDGPFLLEYHDAKGALTRTLSIAGPRRPVTAAVRQQWLAGFVRANAGRVGEGGQPITLDMQRLKTETRFADSLPALQNIVPLPDGSVWVEDFRVTDESGWAATLISPQGRIVGRVVGAGPAHPVAWGRDRVVLASKDEDGIVSWKTFKIVGG